VGLLIGPSWAAERTGGTQATEKRDESGTAEELRIFGVLGLRFGFG
jgi:hypothetical protein